MKKKILSFISVLIVVMSGAAQEEVETDEQQQDHMSRESIEKEIGNITDEEINSLLPKNAYSVAKRLLLETIFNWEKTDPGHGSTLTQEECKAIREKAKQAILNKIDKNELISTAQDTNIVKNIGISMGKQWSQAWWAGDWSKADEIRGKILTIVSTGKMPMSKQEINIDDYKAGVNFSAPFFTWKSIIDN